MSDPHLPPELLDHTVDHLHDDPSTLKECSLVSKSWITRARTHLFAHIEFKNPKTLKSWKRTFPDPLNSPGYLTQTLSCSQSVTDKGVGDWIKGFSRVAYLEILGHGLPAAQAKVSFTPYHGFSPTLKSLRLEFSMLPTSKIFNLILSFPLLEDLIVVTYFGASTDGGGGTGRLLTAVQPSNPPKFTGSLDLFMRGGMGPIANRLLSLPGGINFREFTFTWFHKGDAQLITALVEECSHSLKSLKIACATDGMSIQPPASAPVTHLRFQSGPRQVRSTSQKRRSLKMWRSCPTAQTSNGSSRPSKPSRPIT